MGSGLARYVARHHWGMFAAFIALGGTAYAATSLPANSVGAKQLKNGAVTSTKLSAGVKQQLKKAGAKGSKGDPGAQGQQGVLGPPGMQGPAGPLTGTLPHGVTLRGTWSVRDQAAAGGNDISTPITWGFSLAAAPATHLIPSGSPAPSGCAGGTAVAPAADPGNVCIYMAGSTNATAFVFDPASAGGNTSERHLIRSTPNHEDTAAAVRHWARMNIPT
jgi:hypothetical protein